MPRNASGTYTLPAGNPVSSGTLIEADWANDTLNDLAAEMTDSLSRSGEGGMLASFKIADGTEALPGLAFTLEPATGLSRAGSNQMDFSVGGSTVIQLNVNGMTVTAGLSVLVDTINESTTDAGVTVEGIKLKDSKIEFSDIVTIDSPTEGELALTATTLDVDTTTIEFTGTTVDLDATTLDIDATTVAVDAVTSIGLTAPTITATASTGLDLSGANLNTDWTVNTDQKIQFRDSTEYIHSSADGQLDIAATDEVQIDTGILDVNGRTTVDSSEDAVPLTVNQNHASSSQAALYVTKDSGTGYVLNLQNDFPTSYTYLAGPTYGYYHVGGEFFHKNGGQTYICRFRDDSDNTNFAVSNIGVYYTGTDTSSPYNRTSSSAANLRVHSNGTLYRSTSSLRFKTDIEDIDDAWADKLLELKPICYKSTAPGEVENNPDEWTYYGFGAEDVAKVDPRYVFLKTHESEFDEDDVETKTELDEPIAEGVQYDRMVPALVNLVKRLTERVETLERKA